jgi:hypothetical protein
MNWPISWPGAKARAEHRRTSEDLRLAFAVWLLKVGLTLACRVARGYALVGYAVLEGQTRWQ